MTPYINPYSFTVLLLFRKESAWRVGTYPAQHCDAADLFAEFHQVRALGTLAFLRWLLPFTTPDREHTEEAIAVRHAVPIFRRAPLARGGH